MTNISKYSEMYKHILKMNPERQLCLLALAIIFHDSVYVPGGKNNEEESVFIFKSSKI